MRFQVTRSGRAGTAIAATYRQPAPTCQSVKGICANVKESAPFPGNSRHPSRSLPSPLHAACIRGLTEATGLNSIQQPPALPAAGTQSTEFPVERMSRPCIAKKCGMSMKIQFSASLSPCRR